MLNSLDNCVIIRLCINVVLYETVKKPGIIKDMKKVIYNLLIFKNNTCINLFLKTILKVIAYHLQFVTNFLGVWEARVRFPAESSQKIQIGS